MRKLMVGLVAFAIVSGAVAGDSVKKSDVKVPSVKSGKCSITLLDADGIKPLAGAKLKIQSLKDTKKIVSAEANQAGLCKVDLEKGRYVLSVNDKMLTLLDVEKNGQLAWCRIVVSAKPMLIGGQAEAAEGASGGFTFMGLSGGAAYAAAGAVGIVAVGAVGGGGYLIYDNNRDDDDDDKAPTPPPAAPPADERPPSASR